MKPVFFTCMNRSKTRIKTCLSRFLNTSFTRVWHGESGDNNPINLTSFTPKCYVFYTKIRVSVLVFFSCKTRVCAAREVGICEGVESSNIQRQGNWEQVDQRSDIIDYRWTHLKSVLSCFSTGSKCKRCLGMVKKPII